MVEEHPDMEDDVLGTVITKAEDIEKLKISAGIISDDEGNLVAKARNQVNKLKTMRKWLRDNKKEMVESIEYGHEFSDLLRDYGKYVSEEAATLANTITTQVKIDSSKVQEMDITPPKKTRGLNGAETDTDAMKEVRKQINKPVKAAKKPAKAKTTAKKAS